MESFPDNLETETGFATLDRFGIIANTLPLAKSNVPVTFQILEETIEKRLPEQEPFHALLPGMESQPETCQEPVPHYCNACGTSFWISRSCNERGCPVCFEKWAWIEAGHAARRIWTKRQDDRKKGIYSRAHHVVVSIVYKGQSYEKLKKLARKVARRHGVDGECSIYHQWRKSDLDEWAFDGTIHFHMAGLASGFISFKTKRLNSHDQVIWDDDQDGVIFRVIKNVSTPDKPYAGIPKVHELRKVIAYQLSHCSVMDDHHTVVWSGSLAYTKWSQAQVDQFGDAPIRKPCCPKCESDNTEPCDQWDIIPTFTHHSWENHSLMGWIQTHPYPEEPPPPRRKVSLLTIVQTDADVDWLISREDP